MKKSKVGIFFLLLILLSSCQPSIAADPVVQNSPTPTPSPIIDLSPSPRPTSTFDPSQPEASGGFPYCQVAPQKPRLGSSVNLSAFRLPANHPVSIYIYYDENRTVQVSTHTILTDDNGYVNVDIVIPWSLSTEKWASIALIAEGPRGQASCGIWPWTEISLATYSAWQTQVYAPTLTVPPEQAAMTATQQYSKDTLGANCYYGSAQAIRLSPNGQWAEAICGYDSIIIARTDGTKEWSLSSDSLVGPYTDHFVYVSHWSNDDTYVYIYANPHTEGYWEPFHTASDVFRLHLESGQISHILKNQYYSYSFSPNDRRLAYIITDQSPVILNIRDQQTGAEQAFEFDSKYNTGGRFLWAPDSQSVVFSITQYDENLHEYIATSIVLCEPKRPACTTLLTEHKEVLVPVEWVNDSIILLQALYEDEMKFELNRVTGELKQVGP
jgi:hypothetical protein